ncbi:unnamed protein product [Brassicogethes aeneus]|uniref:Uncharacterized protein n=1 Tax=Brassicogethes aeneus TaxID=1431903 RepID=A0A9P0AUX4_BRAAE|nr:unnamed protein product [Brassicogethes aeneus]
MSEDKEMGTAINGETAVVPESPKPLAFTIDFGGEKKVDPQKQQNILERIQKRHKRGQSMSKIEDKTMNCTPKHPLTGNLPRKSSFQSEGYFSSDEKTERAKSAIKRSDLTLQLKNVAMDQRMTQSFPSTELSSIISPEVELKDISSPELDLVSPFSPRFTSEVMATASSSESEVIVISDENFVNGGEFDFDQSDTASDAGTYTLDAENYSEEQKERMSIDREFKIETMSVQQKTEAYIKSLAEAREKKVSALTIREHDVVKAVQMLKMNEEHLLRRNFLPPPSPKPKTLSPIMSPTQNLSITQTIEDKQLNNSSENDSLNNTYTRIMFPSPKAKNGGLVDSGSVISVTSSGAFRSKNDKPKRKCSLSKSEVQVEAFIDDKPVFGELKSTPARNLNQKLTVNIVNVQNIEVGGRLPPPVGGYSGKSSPTKIPSPIHTNRPRSTSSQNVDLSDSSLDTENILRPTQNFINSLQQRLSLESDPDSDFESKYGMQLNNTAHLLNKQRATHIRHNSLDDRAMNISNKLEHFQSKNLQGIDQTYSNVFNQYQHGKVMHKIQNSPNNSPIRRSSSFTTKNQINSATKNTNVLHREVNLCNSPVNLQRIQRSSSTASIKPNLALAQRRCSIEHQKIDRSQFGDTESSSEEDFEKTLQKRRDLGNVASARCNRAFGLRRARADAESSTPEARRKLPQPEARHPERAISMDRKPVKTEVQSRYLMGVSKRASPSPAKEVPKSVAVKLAGGTPQAKKAQQAFARTDSGRFSMRGSPKPPASAQKSLKKDNTGKKCGGTRSNSSLSSREVEFQNWKRRKSYDPMKAAAEGKRKQEMAKQRVTMTQPCGMANGVMTQSYTEANHSQDSSPSHSSSVHRSQSFHGTAALGQLISSEEEEEDLTLSPDEGGLSPPTPSPCEQSPVRNSWKHALLSRNNYH